MIKKPTILFISILTISLSATAGADNQFPVECLYDSISLEIKSDYTAELVKKLKLRFNQAGDAKYSAIRESINNYVEFSIIRITHTFPDGNSVKLKESDIETISDFGPGYYTGNKTRIINLPSAREGAIAEIAYKLKFKSLLYLPQFIRQRDIPTYNSFLEVSSKIPTGYFATSGCFETLDSGSYIRFSVDTIPPFEPENHMPPIDNFRIIVRPDTVEYEKKKYGFTSWADVAGFYNDLAEGMAAPSADIAQLANDLCSESHSYLDSLKGLFNFVRDNIRYISLDIGRGEFQPLNASDVLRKKYGDCKDQSTLLIALCRSAGIKANPALITTRDRPDVVLDLPWQGYFNHVITAIDTGSGYLFLDASRPTCCFGNLPAKLRNRRALICGTESFLDFTLTSPHDPGNRIDIKVAYQLYPAGNFRCDIDIELFKESAFEFYSTDSEKILPGVVRAFMGNGILKFQPSGFKIIQHTPDFIKISGQFFDKMSVIPKSRRLLLNIRSPFSEYLKKYFNIPGRANPCQFDFTFNMKETVELKLTDGFMLNKDSVNLAFNERGLNSALSLISDKESCQINREFKVFDYAISADRYGRFYDFFLIASQIAYNSIEVMPENKPPEEDSAAPDSW
jgi:hypothetical protein